ncbi:hypothetical protein L6R52_30430 [Myxococcota bacterium]|nr:hypothetical protein [Myxococcota bacterium]
MDPVPRSRRISLALALAALTVALPTAARAEVPGKPVGLGVAAGFAVPSSGEIDYDLGFAWGFYVDIPLVYTFHLTPSATIYRLAPSAEGIEGTWNTDLSLNFKFVVPLGPLEPYGGILAGLSTEAADLNPHVGLIAGAQLSVLPNIDVFAQLDYKLTLRDAGNLSDVQLYVGPIFRFY